jgi:hypothetical protein
MPGIFHLFLLRKALINHLGERAANEILPMQLVEGEGLKKEEKAERVVMILNDMDQKLEINEVKLIRRSMSCLLTKQQIAVMDRAKEKEQLEQQIEMINSGFDPGHIEVIDGGYNFYFNRPGCICRMGSKIPDQRAPASFCECCGGNILRIFGYWLSKELEIEFVQTFLLGGNNCIFKLSFLN